MTDTPATDENRIDTIGLDAGLVARGWNLAGVLSADRYDGVVAPGWRCAETLPDACSAVLLGCGGSAFFRVVRSSPEWNEGPDPADRFARSCIDSQCERWRDAGFASRGFLYNDRRNDRESNDEPRYADFSALAVACGLGVPSRLGILLHPRFGPWFSIRALVLTSKPIAPTASHDWDPCTGCAAPCADACPSERAFRSHHFDVEACFAQKLTTPRCQTRCDARRACVYGREHAYDSDAERYYTQSAAQSATQSASRIARVVQAPGSSG